MYYNVIHGVYDILNPHHVPVTKSGLPKGLPSQVCFDGSRGDRRCSWQSRRSRVKFVEIQIAYRGLAARDQAKNFMGH